MVEASVAWGTWRWLSLRSALLRSGCVERQKRMLVDMLDHVSYLHVFPKHKIYSIGKARSGDTSAIATFLWFLQDFSSHMFGPWGVCKR